MSIKNIIGEVLKFDTNTGEGVMMQTSGEKRRDGKSFKHQLRSKDFTPEILRLLIPGNRFRYDAVLDGDAPDPTKHHKAVNLTFLGDVNPATPANPVRVTIPPKNVSISIGTALYRAESALGVSVQYMENNIGVSGIDLKAYVGSDKNPIVKPLEGINSYRGDDEPFSLLTGDGGVAIDGILLKDIPSGCNRVTVVTSEGKRGTGKFSKEVLKKIKDLTTSDSEKKKNVVYSLLVTQLDSYNFRVKVMADDKATPASISVSAYGAGSDEAMFIEPSTGQSSKGFIELSNKTGNFAIKVNYSLGSLDLSIDCSDFGIQEYHTQWN